MGARVFGVFFFSFGLASLMGFIVQLYVVATLGYQAMFWILTFLTGVSLVINLKFFEEISPWKKYDEKELIFSKDEITS